MFLLYLELERNIRGRMFLRGGECNTRLDPGIGIPTFRRIFRWKSGFEDVGACPKGIRKVFKMFLSVFIMFACFELRKLSFEMKRPRGQKPGSAAEGEVRPPKVAWFRMHVRPPKEESVGHHKSPFARDLSVKHSVFGSKVGSSSPWCVSHVFLKSCMF